MAKSHDLMPLIVKGTLANVTFDEQGETLYLEYDAIAFLFEKGMNVELDNQFENVTNLTDQVACLFALSKAVEAWQVINENYTEIDFLGLMQTPYFQLDRQATTVYKYEYAQGIFDDATYAYFNVISGSFFDEDFMYKYLGTCMTRKEILDKLVEAYNGYQAVQIGLIEYTDSLRTLFDACSEEAEDISEYIVGEKQTIEFSSNDIIDFMNKGYITDAKYIAIAIRAIFERSEVIEEEKECIDKAWDYLFNNADYKSIIKNMRFDTLPYTEAFIKYVNKNKVSELCSFEFTGAISYALLNSPAFYFYPHTILNEFKSVALTYMTTSLKSIFITELDASLYENSYILETLPSMDDFLNNFVRSPYYIPWRLIYNQHTKKLYSGRWTRDGRHIFHTYEQDEIEDALNWILYDTDMNSEVRETFDSQEEYDEARLALSKTATQIIKANEVK